MMMRNLIMKTVIIFLAILLLSISISSFSSNWEDDWGDKVTSDVYYANGDIKHFDSSAFGRVNDGEIVKLHVSLPKNEMVKDGVLCFTVYNAIINVYWDDKCLYSYGKEINDTGLMLGREMPHVNIPDNAWGDELIISLEATENDAFSSVEDLQMYDRDTAYKSYINNSYFSFFVAFSCIFLAVFGMLLLIFQGRGGLKNFKIKGICIIWLSLTVGFWMLLHNGNQNLLGINFYFCNQLEFILMFSITYPMLVYSYLLTDKKMKFSKVLEVALTVNILFFIIASSLNFANIVHYSGTLLYSHIFTLINLILVLIDSLISMHSNRSDEKDLFAMGVAILSVVGTFDLLVFNLLKGVPSLSEHDIPTLMPVGTLIFILLLVLSYYVELLKQREDIVKIAVNAKKFADIFESIPSGICMIKPELEIPLIETNEYFYQIFGYTKEEAEKKGFTSLRFPIEESEISRLINEEKAMIENGTMYYETYLKARHKSGKNLMLFARASLSPHNNGNIIASIIDATDRFETDEKLRMSEESYILALRQSGKIFFDLDILTRTQHFPRKLADKLDLPESISDVPDSIIIRGLVSPVSVPAYRNLYQKMYDGEVSGEAKILTRTSADSSGFTWFEVGFTSVFDNEGMPVSAVVTYSDLTKEHDKEINNAWTQQNMLSLPEVSYAIEEYNLTQGKLLHTSGELYDPVPEIFSKYDEICEFMCDNFISEDDIDKYRAFFDKNRLQAMFLAGKTDQQIEYRSLQRGSVMRWTETSMQMIQDPYSGEILVRFFNKDINEQKVGQIRLERNMDELKKELENSRIKIMINQMQPHFLYNALSAIRTITKRDPDYAYDLLYDFTTHLRGSIKALQSDTPIPFTDELKNIKAYLNIERMRFGDYLRVQYEIDCDNFDVIPLSIQPLAENAARHGVYPRGEEGGTVIVRSFETEDSYIIEIEDDGVGFDVNEVLKESNDSVALKNLIFRLKSLMDADVDIHSEINKGTKATVTIPKM